MCQSTDSWHGAGNGQRQPIGSLNFDKLAPGIADTALWTVAYRAEESARPDALFHDPYAQLLAGGRGRAHVGRVNRPEVRWGVLLRTVALDELVLQAVHTAGCDVVVNLAAGLDTRPYRLDLPASLSWIEVDLPDLISYTTAALEQVTARCLILAEGLLGYLSASEVAALAADLHAQPRFATWLTHLFGPTVVSRIQSAVDQITVADSSVRFAPRDGFGFFQRYGWVKTQHRDLFDETVRVGRVAMLPQSTGQFPNQTSDDPAADCAGAITVARLDRAG